MGHGLPGSNAENVEYLLFCNMISTEGNKPVSYTHLRTMLFHWNMKATMLATTMQAVPPHRVQLTLCLLYTSSCV